MTKSEAVRLFVAAQDDPVLAAWAAVAHENKMSPFGDVDVSPYEYWEAYQDLYDYGLITAAQFNGTDVRQVFFSGRRPPTLDIQRVLDNLRMLPEHATQEPFMSRTKLPDNPFASNPPDGSLVSRGSSGLANNGTSLPAQRSTPSLNPFAGRENLPAAAEGRGRGRIPAEAFQSGNSGPLACRDSARPELGRSAAGGELELQISCCRVPLEMEVADMQADGPDTIPGGQITVIDRVLHGTCKVCGREHHHSVGEVTSHDAYR